MVTKFKPKFVSYVRPREVIEDPMFYIGSQIKASRKGSNGKGYDVSLYLRIPKDVKKSLGLKSYNVSSAPKRSFKVIIVEVPNE